MLSLLPEMWPLVIDERLGSLESLRVTCRALYRLLAPLRQSECYDKRVIWNSDKDKKEWFKCILQPYDRDTTQIYCIKRWNRISVAPTEEMMTFHSQLLDGEWTILLRVNAKVHSVFYHDGTKPPAFLWHPLPIEPDSDTPNYCVQLIVDELRRGEIVCCWTEAVEAYLEKKGDIVDAIMMLVPYKDY